MNELLKHFLRWLIVVALQVGIFNQIGLMSLFNPFIYPFFILMLPLATPRSLLMILAFTTGLAIDIFSNTGGLHAFASTLVAFVRPHWVKIAIPRSNYDDLSNIKLRDVEFGQFLAYTAPLLLVHHLSLYAVESLRADEFFMILGKTLTNAFLALLGILAMRYFDLSPHKGK